MTANFTAANFTATIFIAAISAAPVLMTTIFIAMAVFVPVLAAMGVFVAAAILIADVSVHGRERLIARLRRRRGAGFRGRGPDVGQDGLLLALAQGG